MGLPKKLPWLPVRHDLPTGAFGLGFFWFGNGLGVFQRDIQPVRVALCNE